LNHKSSATSPQNLWLWPGQAPGPEVDDDFRPWLESYLVDTETPRGAVLVIPGGGYVSRASHKEGEPIARYFNEKGLHAFVVQYRVKPHPPPSAFLDVARSMRLIRHHAAEWQVKPDQIAACGFSAGGHLSGLLGVHFDAGDPSAADPIEHFSNRPDALILCYPWLSAKDVNPNDISVQSGQTAEEVIKGISVDLNVSPQTPPAFIWHTFEDQKVSVEHSLLFAEALRQQNISFELHVYPEGPHGLAMAPNNPHVASWLDLCCQWLDNMNWQGICP
jgi:acetyl esterase/lipase